METSRTLYFAYGSNLSRRQMARRCPGARPVGRAVAGGYRLAFPRWAEDWHSGVASIEPAAGNHVEGALYELGPADVRSLDAYEGISEGEYEKGTIIVVRRGGRRVRAMTYFAVPEPGGPFPPTRSYINTILEGASDHHLSPNWVDHVRKQQR